VGWRFTASPSFVLTQHLALGTQKFKNTNGTGFELGGGNGSDLTWRADFNADGPASPEGEHRCSGSTGSSSSRARSAGRPSS
jgi:hypothetical protein